MENSGPKRLQVFMASCGVASRRKCEEMIAEGRVAVNGKIIARQGEKVDPSSDVVTLDGKRLAGSTGHLYLALNKPPGFICTNEDPFGRPRAVDLLGAIGRKNRLFSVGRLDFTSSGLIFFTNDGEFAREVAHPSAGIEKEYLVETRQPMTRELLDEFRAGVTYKGVRYRIERYSMKGTMGAAIVLREGKNRELRNMFAARRVQVRRIHRIRVGTIALGTLAPGEFRFLARKEVARLLEARTAAEQRSRSRKPAGRESLRKRSGGIR